MDGQVISLQRSCITLWKPRTFSQDFPPGTWWRAIVFIRDATMRGRAHWAGLKVHELPCLQCHEAWR